jgi:spermidine/putrescine transport system substrate-binding protein
MNSSFSQHISRRRLLKAALAATASGTLVNFLVSCDRSEPLKLSFLNWQDYIGDTTLRDFETATGIDVSYQTYPSNDQLEWLLNQGASVRRGGRRGESYDLCVPSNDVILKFYRGGLLQDLDLTKITGLENLRSDVRNLSFDPENKFSIPWATGTTGIAYDSFVFSVPPDWTVFLDSQHAGKMTMLDDSHDAIVMALLSLEKDPNSTDEADVNAAADQLIAMSKNAAFNSETYLRELAAGNLVAAQAFSSDFVIAKDQNPSLEFVLPVQGATRWIDSLVIPARAPRPGRAHEFISFFLQGEHAAGVSAGAKVDTGNAAAFDLIPADVRNNPVIFPPSDVLAKLPFLADLGDAQALYDNVWRRVKAG